MKLLDMNNRFIPCYYEKSFSVLWDSKILCIKDFDAVRITKFFKCSENDFKRFSLLMVF